MGEDQRKNADELVNRLLTEGWVIVPGRKHRKIRSPGGRLVVFSATSVSTAGFRNLEALVRRIQREEKAAHLQGRTAKSRRSPNTGAQTRGKDNARRV